MPENETHCVVCEQTEQQVPLLAIQFKEQTYWICPQHLPMLIHKPQTLVGKLPGVENLQPHEH
jgi:hypothetical protein